jgi:hypothetical protein
MGIDVGPIESTDGLIVHLDGGNSRSYSGSGNTWYNLITGAIGGTMVGVGYSSFNGGYFNFTGSQYMTFATTPPIGQSTLSSTVEIVAYRNTYDFAVMLGGGPYGTNQGYWFGHRNATDNFMMAYFANDLDAITPTTNVAWNHYVATYDNSTGKRVTYYNSRLLAQNVPGVSNTSNSSYFIGAYREAAGSPVYQYNGRIAFVKIYNRALTSTEIFQNYHATKGRYK